MPDYKSKGHKAAVKAAAGARGGAGGKVSGSRGGGKKHSSDAYDEDMYDEVRPILYLQRRAAWLLAMALPTIL